MKKLLSLLALLPLVAVGQPFSGGFGPFPKQGYGDSGVTNILVKPNNSFTIGQAGGWNPIVVSGAGTTAANQTYYQIVTQANTPTFTGLGYAVWTNSANSLCLVLNDSNQVPSVSLSNLWTIQDMAGNYKYDLFGAASSANTPIVGSNPFGTWEVSGLGGSAGTDPAPNVGTVPNLIAVTRTAPSNSVLTLSPGVYDIGQYTWFPTNLTVVAHGAFISSLNIIEGMHPYGLFEMYGGGFSNAANYYTVGPSQNGSAMLRLTDCQSNILFDSVNLFACTDGPTGALQDNTSLTFRNCIGGTLWDFATLSAVGGATNTSVNFLGCRLWSKTNGLTTANVFITPSTVNQVRVVGCLLQAGPGFVTGGGILQAAANTTNEVSGTVINLSQQANGTVYKIKQTAGTMIVPFGDFNLSDVNGTITWKGYSSVTNFTAYAAGTAYTLTGSSAALTFGTTQPLVTINQAGTYLIQGHVGLKYVGATYAGAQTLTLKFRRTNNTAADLTSGSRAMEMPVLTTFTGGDVFGMPPVIYTATSGDTVTIFGILSATPSAGSVTADTAEIVAVRLY